jgi:predicted nucleic acid-binding protein
MIGCFFIFLASISTISYKSFGFVFLGKGNALLCQIKIISLDFTIASPVIGIKKNKKIKLPDAIILAIALAQNLEFITCNVKDFSGIKNLKIINPFE